MPIYLCILLPDVVHFRLFPHDTPTYDTSMAVLIFGALRFLPFHLTLRQALLRVLLLATAETCHVYLAYIDFPPTNPGLDYQ